MIADMQAAFLDDIIAHPDDDTPRLIYADWLDDNGDPLRAEFIRLQVNKERDPDWHGFLCLPERLCKNCRRVRELLNLAIKPQTSALAWSQPIHSTGIGLGRVWMDVLTFRRGFVSEIRCTLSHWYTLKHGPAIAKAHPLERVTLTDKEPSRVGDFWQWTRGVDGAPDDLPGKLFDIVAGRLIVFEGRYQFRTYQSRQEAIDALSAACIKWARLPAEQRGR